MLSRTSDPSFMIFNWPYLRVGLFLGIGLPVAVARAIIPTASGLSLLAQWADWANERDLHLSPAPVGLFFHGGRGAKYGMVALLTRT